ncbi:MAG: DNA gyrase subunit A [Chloroflexota bacterium]|nr:DNA gyrase subunit A [Chloroflexota bacterium]
MDIGTVKPISIDQEMRGSYLDYAMSVIVARALPDVCDGLKPVQRRILYAMHDMGLRHDRPHRKSARIVGEVLGKYHPHSDTAVYDAMARMAQDFSLRYLLVDGQGNFGSIDGDSPAAMRYTEARMSGLAEEMLVDIDKDTVHFTDNFDGTLQEPVVLPARLPNLLINGSSGIAVGMTTNIPPHNLGEVCDALTYLIDHYERADEISVDELMQFIPGPDFPTGGMILGQEGVRSAYATGRGRVVMRAVTHIEDIGYGRHRIVVTEIPYQVNKSSLVERIAYLVREDRVPEVADLRDESDRRGMSIVIELKRTAQPRKVLNRLLKYTPLQSTFGVRLLALVNGEPRLLPLKRALLHYIDHRRDVLTRRTRYELDQAQHRAHILQGLLTALDSIDAVIATIRRAPDAGTARAHLMEQFDLSPEQAQAILNMQLRRLAALERKRIQEEYGELQQRITYLQGLLATPQKILQLIREDLAQLKEQYGDPRRTQIAPEASAELEEEDLIADQDVLISLTRLGYVKSVSRRSYKRQNRGGRGVTGMTIQERDTVQHLLAASTLDTLLLFTDQGKVYSLRAFDVPNVNQRAKGTPIVNLLKLGSREGVTAVISVPEFDQAENLTMATRLGHIKRTHLQEFASVRPSGLIALSLEEGDELGWVSLTTGDQELILVTAQGQAIRFPESEVSVVGRTAMGVMAIRLEEGDRVAAMDVVRPEYDLLVVTSQGYGKRTPLSEYSTQKRYGKGVRTLDARKLAQTGPIVDAQVVRPGDGVTLISAEGMVIRVEAEEISQIGRNTKGVKLMDLQEGDRVASIARLEQ